MSRIRRLVFAFPQLAIATLTIFVVAQSIAAARPNDRPVGYRQPRIAKRSKARGGSRSPCETA